MLTITYYIANYMKNVLLSKKPIINIRFSNDNNNIAMVHRLTTQV